MTTIDILTRPGFVRPDLARMQTDRNARLCSGMAAQGVNALVLSAWAR